MTPPESTPHPVLQALELGAVWIERSARYRLSFRGPDRARSLHNLTTNDIKNLALGHGCEAFITSPQGRTLAFATILATPDEILLRTDADSKSLLEPHLHKYVALDDTQWLETTAQTFEIHLAGRLAQQLLPNPPETPLTHLEMTPADAPLRVVRESILAPTGFTLIGPIHQRPSLLSHLTQRAAEIKIPLLELLPDQFEALRIAHGYPCSGRDLTDKNLPQEVGRDMLAIHFTKGCYLGQETVARLDALGHVNRLLRGLMLDSTSAPPPATPLKAGDKDAGFITTSAVSLRTGKALALAYIKTAFIQPGTSLTAEPPDTPPIPCLVSNLPIEP